MMTKIKIWWLLTRSMAAMHRGKVARSETMLRAVLGLDDRCVKAWRYLGMNYALQSETVPQKETFEAKALECYRQAYSCDPSDRHVVWNLVCFLGYLGRLDDAQAIVAEFAKAKPDSAERLRQVVEGYRNGSTRGLKEAR